MGKSGGTRHILRRILRPTLSDCLAVWLLAGLCFALPLTDRISAHDLWWHLQTGKIIATTHSIPTTDVYSFTVHGQPWLVHEWLSLLLAWIVYSWAGYGGLAVAKSVLILATFTVVFAVGKMRTSNLRASILATAVCAFISIVGWSVRPQLLGYLCLAVLIWLILRFKRGASLWPVVPLFALWINLHGSWFVGVVVLLAAGAEFVWERRQGTDDGRLGRFVKVLPFIMAALLINPQPLVYLSYPLQYLGLSAHGQNMSGWQLYVSEWRSPDFHRREFWLLAVTLLVLPILLRRSRAVIRPFEMALALFFGGLSLYSLRHIPVFAIVFAPVLADIAGGLTPTAKNDASDRSPVNWVFLLILPALVWGLIPKGGSDSFLDMRTYPQRSFDYLRGEARHGRLLTNYDWGGYAIGRLWPKYRVFVDGRADVYPPEVAESLKKLDDLKPGWRETLKKIRPDVIVWPKDQPLAQGLELLPEWRRITLEPDDSVAVVYVPASSSRRTADNRQTPTQ